MTAFITAKGTEFDASDWINDRIYRVIVGDDDGLAIAAAFQELVEEHGLDAAESVVCHAIYRMTGHHDRRVDVEWSDGDPESAA